ncbi:MAG TPA: hypothetical protein VH682_32425 [Gemmataceae bacterium]
MTEEEWLAGLDPTPMLEHIRVTGSERKLRLFACALARQVWSLLCAKRIRKAVESAERFADGQVSKGEMTAAGAAAQQAAWTVYRGSPRFKSDQTAAAYDTARSAAYAMATEAAIWAYMEAGFAEISAISRRAILHDIFCNPFRPITLDSSWLTWHDGLLVSMARQMYDSRDFSDMPILADALEESGCQDQDILGHCRSGGEHVRGCWVVDLVLGKS